VAKLIAFPVFGAIVLLGGQLWAQYGPPPVIGQKAAAADTGGVGSYGDTMDEIIGNGTRTYWGMGRGLSGDATLGSGTSGYSAMGLAGYGQTTGAAQIVPYYSLGASAGAVNYGNESFGLGGTPGFGRIWFGPSQAGDTASIYGNGPNSYFVQNPPPRGIPPEKLRGLVRVTPAPYAPPGNPGFVDPGVAQRANEYTFGVARPAATPPQTLTGNRSAYPPAPAPRQPPQQQK
jgi:hypothetical protein